MTNATVKWAISGHPSNNCHKATAAGAVLYISPQHNIDMMSGRLTDAGFAWMVDEAQTRKTLRRGTARTLPLAKQQAEAAFAAMVGAHDPR